MTGVFTTIQRRLGGAALLVVFGALGTAVLYSQQANQTRDPNRPGVIRGTVADPSGAVIPSTQIEVQSQETGDLWTTQSDQVGNYSVRNLPRGMYQLSASYPGFTTFVMTDIAITTAHPSVRKDIVLQPASANESITVVDSAAALMAETSASVEYAVAAAAMFQDQQGAAYQTQDVIGRMLRARMRDFIRRARQARNTEEYGKWIENEFVSPQEVPLSTFGVDVDTASYSNIRRFLDNGQLPPEDAVRIEELVNYFTYDYPEPEGDDPVAVTTQLTIAPWNKGRNTRHQLLRIGLRTPSIAQEDLPPSNLTFLVDVSGSMESPDKLPLVQAALKMLSRQLRPEDHVSMVVYAGSSGVVLPPTPGDRQDAILSAIDRLSAGGSTNGAGGIRLAYDQARRNFKAEGNNRVILATDGDFNVGVSSDDELVRLIERERDSGVFLSVLSFGTGNLKDTKMEKLADHGNGNYAYIDSMREARKVFVEQMGATLLTVAKDVKLQIEFNPAEVASYRLIGYENRLLDPEDFNDDTKDAGDLGAGHQVTAFYEIVPVGSGDRPAVDGLRYQQQSEPRPATTPTNLHPGELAWLKLRYKDPDSSESQLFDWSVDGDAVDFDQADRELRFAAAVAEYGLLLRGSEYKGNASFDHVLATASEAVGPDLNGYRTGFLDLVRTANELAPGGRQYSAR